jgi:hypothetical protein
MHSRVAAACSRVTLSRSVSHYNNNSRALFRAQIPTALPILARHLSVSPAIRASAVLAHAPTQADLDANEEFSETEALPQEEASLNITDAAAEVRRKTHDLVERPQTFYWQQLRDISMRENDENIALRVLVESGGCHGYQYKMELTSERQPSD